MKSTAKSIFPKLSGKYGVGVQDFTKKSSFLTRVFYPAQLNNEYASDFWHPDLQYLKSYQPLVSNPDKLHPLTLNSVQHGAAPLSGLTFPGIIFSHGLFGNRFSSSALCSQLASKGYVVYAIEHNDGTASVTRRLNENNLVDSFYYQKQPKKLDSKVFKFRLNQLETRKNEILELAQELNQNEHFNMTKSPSETEDLIVGGHSFGAAASFVSYVENQEVFKTSFGLDTWTFMLNKEQLGRVTKNKILSVMSEEFMGFPAVAKKIEKIDNQTLVVPDKSNHMSVASDLCLVREHFVDAVEAKFDDLDITVECEGDSAGILVETCEAIDEFLKNN